MFDRMNRRLYHTIRIWFKVFAKIVLVIALVIAHIKGINWINQTYGATAGFLSAFGLAINDMLILMSWFHSGTVMFEYDRRAARIIKKTEKSFSEKMFLRMNHRIHHAIKIYIFSLLFISASIGLLVGIVATADYILVNYGTTAALLSAIVFMAVVVSGVIAYHLSELAVEEEQKKQDNVLKSLKKDWL